MSVEERFWVKVAKTEGCWLWTAGRFAQGYGAFKMGGKLRKAHRVAWELVHGPIPDGQMVCHSCDNPPCVRPDHFFLGTSADNIADRDAKGRTAAGDRSPARLHPESRPRGEKHWTHQDPERWEKVIEIARRPEHRPRGETHGKTKLTDAAIIEIQQRYSAGGITQTTLARMFGVDQTTISRVVLDKARRRLM